LSHSPDQASTAMVDVVFSLEDGSFDDDHADALSLAVRSALPWFDDEPEAGILPLSGLAHGNNGQCFVGRRSRLALRLPIRRSASADFLAGRRLDLGGSWLTLGKSAMRPLFPARGVVYSHLVNVGSGDEIEFLARCRALLAGRGLRPQLISGKVRRLATAEGPLFGFSLMLHGLGAADSLAVQEAGLGSHRTFGCGIFIPHKSVVAVGG